jgi:porin
MKKAVSFLIIVLCFVAGIVPVKAQEEPAKNLQESSPDTSRVSTPFGFFNQDYLLGDLGGGRTWLEEHGFSLELVYTAEFFWNTRGGMNTHKAREYRGDVSLFGELDTGEAGWWHNGAFFLHVQEGHGHGITSRHVGDFQVLSNIDADDFQQISQFWYRHSFLDNRLWVKLGKMEANDDFAFVEFGGEFINSSGGYGPTIPLVTFPDQDWGMVVGSEPVEWFSANVGVYQGRPDGGRSIGATLDNLYGPMVMAEPAFHYQLAGLPGHFRVGGWLNGDHFDEFDRSDPDPGTFGDSYGWYLTWDQLLWPENPGREDDAQGIAMFAQYGWAPEDRSEAQHYISGGIQWVGALPCRDDDILGIGVFHVELSDEAGFDEQGETATELFYKVQLCKWMSVKPDLQYITNPGGSSNRDAVAVGMRFETLF